MRVKLSEVVAVGDALEHRLAERKRQAILDELRHGLEELSDEQMAAIEDPLALGRSMAHLVAGHTGSFGKLVGPLYSSAALELGLGISPLQLHEKVAAGELLALRVGEDLLFPVFQFRGREVREDVISVVRVLRTAVDAFTIAQWLCTPLDQQAARRTPLQLLNSGQLPLVLEWAEQASARWSA